MAETASEKRRLAEVELDAHQGELARLLGEDYRSDPRYAEAVKDVAGGRDVRFVLMDFRVAI
jgi:hypothetical protein